MYFCFVNSEQRKLERINGCIIMPTYNNEKTVGRVLNDLLSRVAADRVIVVNDGATDGTPDILKSFNGITLLENSPNKGKGYSLRKAFKFANKQGFNYAVTIDSDGQHFPSDLNVLLDAVIESPNHVIMGSRNMEQDGVPGKSSFGNKFSNFWFKIETLISLPDTQTGYRIYPLKPLKKMRLFTSKFELEIEVIVRLAWKNVPFKAVPIQVKYDPEERVSHFRPGRDFFRISVLNSVLVLGALLYFFPKKLLSFNTLKKIKEEAIKPKESNLSKSLSLGFGVFMGIIPIWGFQLLVGIPLAVLFRLNKVLFITAANISIPPMIPLILYVSVIFGQYVTTGSINNDQIMSFDFDSIQQNISQYMIGAIVFAITAFIFVFLLSFVLLKLLRKEPKS